MRHEGLGVLWAGFGMVAGACLYATLCGFVVGALGVPNMWSGEGAGTDGRDWLGVLSQATSLEEVGAIDGRVGRFIRRQESLL